MYKFFLNSVEIFDLPIGIDNLQLEIVREDGFGNSEQILREKTETTFTFYGDGFRYITDIFKTSICDIIDVEIFDICDNASLSIFKGRLHLTDIERVDLTRKILTTQIRDNSFTGYIKDYLNTNVQLFNTSTKGCEPLTPIGFLANIGTNKVLSFDVLQTFKYYISFFTNNKIAVVSDYLTDNKYLITTGFNLHNTGGSKQQRYPQISFSKLFDELRKKLRLFMVIEYDINNNPYLRIEPESYSFSNSNVLNIIGIPNGTEERADSKRLFNSIEVGSNFTDFSLESDYYPTDNPILSFRKSAFNTCGECSVNNDSQENKLDLVSEFIIDPNVIAEALLEPINSDYTNNDKIFLINYEIVDGIPTSVRTTCNDVPNVYNCNLNNESVVNNWLGFSPQCLALSRYPQDGFIVEFVPANFNLSFPMEFGICTNYINTFPDIVKDLNFTIKEAPNPTNIFVNTTCLPSQTVADAGFTYYKCAKTTNYNFKAEINNFLQKNGLSYSISTDLDLTIYIVVYTDDTFTTIVNQYEATGNTTDTKTIPINLINETGLIPITAGQCVVVITQIYSEFAYVLEDDNFIASSFEFMIVGTDDQCIEFENEPQDAKPRVIKFKKDICLQDWINLRNNKKDIITVNGSPFYIKRIVYNKQRLTEFELIGNKSLL